jgi:hypothetical protein
VARARARGEQLTARHDSRPQHLQRPRFERTRRHRRILFGVADATAPFDEKAGAQAWVVDVYMGEVALYEDACRWESTTLATHASLVLGGLRGKHRG